MGYTNTPTEMLTISREHIFRWPVEQTRALYSRSASRQGFPERLFLPHVSPCLDTFHHPPVISNPTVHTRYRISFARKTAAAPELATTQMEPARASRIESGMIAPPRTARRCSAPAASSVHSTSARRVREGTTSTKPTVASTAFRATSSTRVARGTLWIMCPKMNACRLGFERGGAQRCNGFEACTLELWLFLVIHVGHRASRRYHSKS